MVLVAGKNMDSAALFHKYEQKLSFINDKSEGKNIFDFFQRKRQADDHHKRTDSFLLKKHP